MRGDHVKVCGPLIMSDPKKTNVNGLSSHRLVFEDSNHQEKMLMHLNTMRKEGHFCDATLEVGGHSFPVHRAVLASCSMYLFELFSSKEEANAKQHFKLKEGLDCLSFEVLINYTYTGRLECDGDLVKSVYKTASVLKMPKVVDQCSQFLTENLTLQTCLGVRAFASAYSDLDLTTKTNRYIEEHLKILPERSPEFMRLPGIVVDIVGVEPCALNSSSEKQLCLLVVDWIEMALDERPIERLTENHQILYLANGNSLRDCLDDLGDCGLNNSDIVRDYKRLGQRKQLQPVKGKREKGNTGGRMSSSPSLSSLGDSASVELQPQNGVHQPQKRGQFDLVASKMVGDKSFMCIAVLDNALVSISIKLRSCSEVDGKPENSSSPIREKCRSPFESQCSFTLLSSMSSARCGLGTAVLGNRLIALGGYDRGDCLNSVEGFDLGSNTWSPLKAMNMARGRFAVAQMDNKLYACGGCNGHSELSSAECYDPVTDHWTSLPQMIIKRSSAGVTACDGKVYVVGGWSGCSGHSACEMYDPDFGQWQAIADLNLGRSQTGVCAVNGKIVAIGGCDAWNCTNTVEIYDEANDEWTYLPPMSLARRGAGVAFFKGKLYVVGGSDGQASLVSVEIYDPATCSWTFGPCLNTPRANMGLSVMNGRLFAVGGFSGKAFLESIEYLSEEASEWSIYLPSGVKSRSRSCQCNESCSSQTSVDEEEQLATTDLEELSTIPNGKPITPDPLETDERSADQQFRCIASIEDELKTMEYRLSLENGFREKVSEVVNETYADHNGIHLENGFGSESHDSDLDEITVSEFV